jgi:hypothetical protein
MASAPAPRPTPRPKFTPTAAGGGTPSAGGGGLSEPMKADTHLVFPSLPSVPTWQPRDLSPAKAPYNECLDMLQANGGVELYIALVPLCVTANTSKDPIFINAVLRLIRDAMPHYDKLDRSPEHIAQVEFTHGLLLLLLGSKEAVQKANQARHKRCANPPTEAEKVAYRESLANATGKMKFALALALAALRDPTKLGEMNKVINDARIIVRSAKK